LFNNLVRPLTQRQNNNLALRLGEVAHAWTLDDVGSLTSHNAIGLHGLLRGQLYFTLLALYLYRVVVVGKRLSAAHEED
jgi:hypothetical protein